VEVELAGQWWPGVQSAWRLTSDRDFWVADVEFTAQYEWGLGKHFYRVVSPASVGYIAASTEPTFRAATGHHRCEWSPAWEAGGVEGGQGGDEEQQLSHAVALTSRACRWPAGQFTAAAGQSLVSPKTANWPDPNLLWSACSLCLVSLVSSVKEEQRVLRTGESATGLERRRWVRGIRCSIGTNAEKPKRGTVTPSR
jgi:hypothetical protein